MLSSIIVAIAVALLVLIADSLFLKVPLPFTKDKDGNGEVVGRNGFEFESESLIKASIIGLAIGAVNFLSPKATGGLLWLAPVLLAVALAVTVYLVWWWSEKGSELRELIPFILLTLIIYPTTMSAAVMAASLWQDNWLAMLTQKLPLIAAVGSGAFYLANLCFFNKEEAEAYEDEKKAKNFNFLGWMIIALALLALVGSFFSLGWGKFNLGSSQNGETFPFFYNSLLQEDGKTGDEYNFGPSLAELNEEDEDKEYTVAEYAWDFETRCRRDPALFAAVAMYTDEKLNTDLLGEYMDRANGDLMTAINLAKEDFINDEDKFQEYVDTFFKRLKTAKVSLEESKKLEDQLYMDPFTTDGVPDVVVYKTLQKDGLMLTYTVNVKNNPVKLQFRTECGYQPTNVAELFGVTPEKHPQTPTEPTPTNPNKPTTPTTPTTPTPTEPSNPKDPSKGTQGPLVGPNDTSGAGPNTNNGKGAQYSSEQTDDGSVFLPNYNDYQEVIDNLNDINDTQREAGDSNKPSYKPPASSNTTVDNSGGAEINNPTPEKKPAVTVDGDKVTSEGPGEAWGGPPDTDD